MTAMTAMTVITAIAASDRTPSIRTVRTRINPQKKKSRVIEESKKERHVTGALSGSFSTGKRIT